MNASLGLAGQRLDLEPERIEQGLARLVLGLVELIREVLERQAIRRVEVGDLSDEEVERLGLALLRLNERLLQLREAFGLTEEDVTLRFHSQGSNANAADPDRDHVASAEAAFAVGLAQGGAHA